MGKSSRITQRYPSKFASAIPLKAVFYANFRPTVGLFEGVAHLWNFPEMKYLQGDGSNEILGRLFEG